MSLILVYDTFTYCVYYDIVMVDRILHSNRTKEQGSFIFLHLIVLHLHYKKEEEDLNDYSR